MIVAKPTRAAVDEDHSATPSLRHYFPPARLVQAGGEGRLVAPLRDAAQTLDPMEILTRAAVAFHRARRPTQRVRDEAMATALADLAVTGRESFARFRAAQPDESSLGPSVLTRLAASGLGGAPADAMSAAKAALDRAYDVAAVLRGPFVHRVQARDPLGWIAVSGEDDPPHRPVNVPSAPYPQHEIAVEVGGIWVETRFFVASSRQPSQVDVTPSQRALPTPSAPEVPDDHRVILFIHGHSSRAEEALELITPLLAAGIARKRPFSIVSVDLPCNGYSSMIDHTEVAESARTTFPGGVFDRGPIQTPVLDFIEDFIVAFVDALDRVTPIKHRIAGIVGGSLGGNMGLRLGRRDLKAFPWLANGIVSWNPACVWSPLVQDAIKRRAPEYCRGRWNEPEDDTKRSAYFRQVFDQPVVPFLVPRSQPSMWYRDGWEPHKATRIRGCRWDRYEVYNASFRRWHWRVAGEQLIYSHLDRVDREDPSSPFRHSLNRARHLLAAGEADDYAGSNIYAATRHLAERMPSTPGRSLFLLDTGHSIHAERPSYLAGEIASFLTEEAERS